MDNKVPFLILRRMRVPLLALIGAYAVSVLGLTLMPGVEIDGRPTHISIFHAFYIITYTATTTGFGELPHAFSDAQRLWVTFSLYLSVVAWVYAIGTLIALFQDRAFKQVIEENRFASAVRRQSEPFYIVCGYGDTGALVVRSMASRGLNTVVIDSVQDRINELTLENLPRYVPGLCANASQPANLKRAGLEHPQCAGVVALTDSDHVNLKIAITAKLIAPGLRVICRAQTHDAQANMASFGTDAVINPFDTFADRLAMALHSPDMHLIHEWLTATPGMPLPERIDPPRGTWLLCGYGRFGKAVNRYLEYEGLSTVIVESEPEKTRAPKETVVGRGTEAVTLRAAHIESAVGIVAGTDDDANNLSIIMTARSLNLNLFMVARQNNRDNDDIFEAARLDLVMQRSRIISRRILALISTPLLTDFLRLARHQSNEWARALIERLRPVIGTRAPALWAVQVGADSAPAVFSALRETRDILLGHLCRDPYDRDQPLPCVPLLLMREDDELLLPDPATALQPGDRLLFCGRRAAELRMLWTLRNANALAYVESGEQPRDTYVSRRLFGRRQRAG
jgi:voltage-gated potassium channel